MRRQARERETPASVSVGTAASIELTALMAIRITADPQRSRFNCGLAAAEFDNARQRLEEVGLVKAVPGGRMSLTDAGLTRLEALLAAERSGLDNDRLPRLYQEFLGLDGEIKSIITDWQLESGRPSPPRARPGDRTPAPRLASRLAEIHRLALELIEQVMVQRPRFGTYAKRLDQAARAIGQGRKEFLSGVKVDSYHLTWFELHEDLLLTLGRKRAG